MTDAEKELIEAEMASISGAEIQEMKSLLSNQYSVKKFPSAKEENAQRLARARLAVFAERTPPDVIDHLKQLYIERREANRRFHEYMDRSAAIGAAAILHWDDFEKEWDEREGAK